MLCTSLRGSRNNAMMMHSSIAASTHTNVATRNGHSAIPANKAMAAGAMLTAAAFTIQVCRLVGRRNFTIPAQTGTTILAATAGK